MFAAIISTAATLKSHEQAKGLIYFFEILISAHAHYFW